MVDLTPTEIAEAQRLMNMYPDRPIARYARHLEAQASRAELSVSDAQIKHMVDRFLGWRLPQPWHPDNGIGYQRPGYAHAVSEYDWPTGTNLFDAKGAEAMVRYMLEGIPVSRAGPSKSSREIVTRLHQAAESIKAYGHVATADTLLEIAATFRSLLVTAQDALPYPERLVELDGGAVRKPYEGGLLRLRDALNRCTAGPLQQRGNSPLCYYGSTNCEDAIAQALDTAKRQARAEAQASRAEPSGSDEARLLVADLLNQKVITSTFNLAKTEPYIELSVTQRTDLIARIEALDAAKRQARAEAVDVPWDGIS